MTAPKVAKIPPDKKVTWTVAECAAMVNLTYNTLLERINESPDGWCDLFPGVRVSILSDPKGRQKVLFKAEEVREAVRSSGRLSTRGSN